MAEIAEGSTKEADDEQPVSSLVQDFRLAVSAANAKEVTEPLVSSLLVCAALEADRCVPSDPNDGDPEYAWWRLFLCDKCKGEARSDHAWTTTCRYMRNQTRGTIDCTHCQRCRALRAPGSKDDSTPRAKPRTSDSRLQPATKSQSEILLRAGQHALLLQHSVAWCPTNDGPFWVEEGRKDEVLDDACSVDLDVSETERFEEDGCAESQAETLQTEEMMLKAMKQEAIMLRAQAEGGASFQTCVRGFGGGISPQPVGQSTARLLVMCETRAAIHQSNVHRLHASGRPDLHDGGGGLRFLLVSPRLSLSSDSLALHGVVCDENGWRAGSDGGDCGIVELMIGGGRVAWDVRIVELEFLSGAAMLSVGVMALPTGLPTHGDERACGSSLAQSLCLQGWSVGGAGGQSQVESWGLCSDGVCQGKGDVIGYVGTRIREGDVVTCFLDADRHTLSFALNAKRLPVEMHAVGAGNAGRRDQSSSGDVCVPVISTRGRVRSTVRVRNARSW